MYVFDDAESNAVVIVLIVGLLSVGESAIVDQEAIYARVTTVSQRLLTSPTAIVMDVSAVLWTVDWRSHGTVGTFISGFKATCTVV